jgi:OOP family OmpA-OmpF porin
MRSTSIILGVLGAILTSVVALNALAAEGRYYDPTNSASQDGKTVGYELFKTIGCPGKGLLDVPCKEPKPVDSDGDGVVDSLDKCPNTPAGVKVDAQGCPLDSDGDGVPDYLDKCPNTPAGVKVDAQGCPLDSDGDGVPDYLDKCPDTPAGVKVDAQGCPLDSDGDGVPDYLDKCPDTPAGVKVDAQGCPVVAQPEPAPAAAPKKLVLEGVNFDNDSANLSSQSYAILDRAAATLKEWGEVKVEVAGYTDWVSSDAYNIELSKRRANAVRDYLISKGIDASRLTAMGYGKANPIADNNTPEGRFKNRRVELIPQQ